MDSVTAVTETFVKERKHNLTGKKEKVGIDDASAFLARFKNGSLATFEATRYARGHKALYTLEINGEHGSLAWDLHDLHRLQWFDHKDEGLLRGWRSIHVTDGDHPYMANWWVPGLAIGFEHSFIHGTGRFRPDLGHGGAGVADDHSDDSSETPGRAAACPKRPWPGQTPAMSPPPRRGLWRDPQLRKRSDLGWFAG